MKYSSHSIVSRSNEEDRKGVCQSVDQNLIATYWLASIRNLGVVWQLDPFNCHSYPSVFVVFVFFGLISKHKCS